MRLGLVKVTEEFVEALAGGRARGPGIAQAPLAEVAGGVAGTLEKFGDGEVFIAQRDGLGVGAHGCVAQVQAGHEDAARWAQTLPPA